MEYFIGFLVGGITIGVIMNLVINSKKSGVDVCANENEREKQKAENLAKLRELIASNSERITNSWIQQELGVSDATATRYLDELEEIGLIKQVGDTGKGVFYEKT